MSGAQTETAPIRRSQTENAATAEGPEVAFKIRFVYTRKNNDIFPYTHNHVIKPSEAGALANVLNRSTTSNKGYALFSNFLPNFIRLPTQGEPHPLDFVGDQDESDRTSDCIFVLGTPILLEKTETADSDVAASTSGSGSDGGSTLPSAVNKSTTNQTTTNLTSPSAQSPSPSSAASDADTATSSDTVNTGADTTDLINTIREDLQQYWSIQCGKDETDAQSAARLEYIRIYVMSSQTSLGQYFEGASVFYIYSLLIIYLASNVRAMFSGGSANTMFYDWPRHDVMKQYCEKIAECRALASLSPEDLKLFLRPSANGVDDTRENIVTPLEAEEEYFRELVDIYRRPDLLYERTGPSRHVSSVSLTMFWGGALCFVFCVCVCVCVCVLQFLGFLFLFA